MSELCARSDVTDARKWLAAAEETAAHSRSSILALPLLDGVLKNSTAAQRFGATTAAAAVAPQGTNFMARSASRLKLGYYPLVPGEAQRIRRFLEIPDGVRGA